MLTTKQLDQYFLDLQNPLMETAIALVHSRFSTNTFPSWDRAHPYRCIAHNGEINTLRGNINWMRAREALFESPLFGEDIKKIPPIVNPNGSDSSMFDNVLELMVLSGRSLPHAVMMMIPEPWSKHASMDPARRAFYQYHSSLMEPWDGPADIAFTDGKRIGAVLDRNGLRPGRYYVTKDDLVVMASEAGVLEFPPEQILRKGRLQPGRMFLVDTEQGRIVEDEEIKAQIINERPYAEWLKQHLVHLKDLPAAPEMPLPEPVTLAKRQVSFGYTFEDQRILMAPMARDGDEGVGSMGNDTPLAALSQKSRMLYDYFKQLFAQVTNPPIDCIREEIITSSDVWLGSEGNLLDPRPGDCRRLELKGPVLTNEEFAKVRRLSLPGLKVGTLRILFRAERGEDGLVQAIEEMRAEAQAHDRGGRGQHPHPVRSRREQGIRGDSVAAGRLGPASLPDPPGPAHESVAGARDRRRARSASLRAAHRLRLLGHQSVSRLRNHRRHDPRRDAAERRAQARLQEFREGRRQGRGQGHVEDGHLGRAELSRRAGVRSGRPAPGRHRRIFRGHRLARRRRRPRRDRAEVLMRHTAAFAERKPQSQTELPSGGQYQWRADGEFHLFNPESIHRLQKSVRTGSYATYKSLRRAHRRPREESLDAARPARLQAGRSDSDRGGRVRRRAS